MKDHINTTLDVPSEVSCGTLLQTNITTGLTSAEVSTREKNGLINRLPPSNTKTEGRIIRENTFTFFNLIFLILAAALVSVGSFKNLTFLMVAIINTIIGIIQEIRAKRAVDALTLVAAATVPVIRNGEKIHLPSDKLVRDDIVEFSAGQQICADGVVRCGTVYVNEALLTGESCAVEKTVGAELKSGSFIISGRCLSQLIHVGKDSYAACLGAEARKNVKSTKSEMMRSLSRLIAFVGIALVPMGILLFLRHYLDAYQGLGLRDSVEATVAALIGMIPEGLYLLTSIAIAASCIKLSKQNVLVQDKNCIETLARVDVLCVDKTGTITEPEMEVVDLQVLSPAYSSLTIENILTAFYYGEEADNETARAMAIRFSGETDRMAVQRIPFSSDTKWAGADFGDDDSYIIGAPEFVLGTRYKEIQEQVETLSERGYRVLLLASCCSKLTKVLDIQKVEPIALIFLNNRLRKDAKETFRYFADQGVSVRVISGDNPITVAEIARKAGISGADQYIDATTLKTEEDLAHAIKNYTVFGRVTPEQKRMLIKAFQSQGHTVAMTGDGVNDVLALKEADCGIAMASGSNAASQISRIVLLDSQFSSMPDIVAEGRRVINNIQRSASLFLVKNIFSFTFTLLLLFVSLPYPLQGIQLTLIGSVTIGIPAFFLALEPNYSRVKGKFLHNIILRALPGGLTDLIMLVATGFLGKYLHWEAGVTSTVSVYLILMVGFITLYHVCTPFSKLRRLVFFTLIGVTSLAIILLPSLLELVPLDPKSLITTLLLSLSIPWITKAFQWMIQNQMNRHCSDRNRTV